MEVTLSVTRQGAEGKNSDPGLELIFASKAAACRLESIS